MRAQRRAFLPGHQHAGVIAGEIDAAVWFDSSGVSTSAVPEGTAAKGTWRQFPRPAPTPVSSSRLVIVMRTE